jgi:hypothetical protein
MLVRPAALPSGTGQHRGDGADQPGVVVAGDQGDAGQAVGGRPRRNASHPTPSSELVTSTPRISRHPALTPVAIRQCALTVRPPSRTFWVSASIHTNV